MLTEDIIKISLLPSEEEEADFTADGSSDITPMSDDEIDEVMSDIDEDEIHPDDVDDEEHTEVVDDDGNISDDETFIPMSDEEIDKVLSELIDED